MQATLYPSAKVASAMQSKPVQLKVAPQTSTKKPTIKRFLNLLMIALAAQAA